MFSGANPGKFFPYPAEDKLSVKLPGCESSSPVVFNMQLWLYMYESLPAAKTGKVLPGRRFARVI
jgi:hypothetical protein